MQGNSTESAFVCRGHPFELMRDLELDGSLGLVRRIETRVDNIMAQQQPSDCRDRVAQYANLAQPLSVPVGNRKVLWHVARAIRHVEERLLGRLEVATVVRRKNLRSI